MNPFIFGKVVEDVQFCPRESLSASLGGCIESGQNTVVYGRRRVGKSSLVLNTCKRFPKRSMLLIDLFFSKDSVVFLRYCSHALFSLNARRQGVVEKTMTALRRVRPRLDVDPDTGAPSLSLHVSKQEGSAVLQTVDEFFDLLDAEFKSAELVVCFDEFQSVLNYPDAPELLARIRGKVQYHGFPYVFTGSDRTGIQKIFTDPHSAFYKSVHPLEVPGLARDRFEPFLEKRFADGKRKVVPEVWDEVFQLDVPGDIQQLCASLWDCSAMGSTIDKDTLDQAYERVFAYEIEGFSSLLTNLTSLQMRVLKQIASAGTRDLYSVATENLIGASGSSIRRSVSALTKKWILVEDQGRLYFNNPFLQCFLVRSSV